MKVSEVYTPNPQCISPDASLMEAAQRMRSLDVGMLPVCDNDRLAGAVTDRDITIRAVAEGLDPKTTQVRQVLTPEICYCFEKQSINEVAEMMEERQIRRLPVLNEHKRLIGIVSLGDLAVRTGKEKLVGEVLERVSEPAHVAL
jgi:CBS domain-containing protein